MNLNNEQLTIFRINIERKLNSLELSKTRLTYQIYTRFVLYITATAIEFTVHFNIIYPKQEQILVFIRVVLNYNKVFLIMNQFRAIIKLEPDYVQ
jgi:hypothetical protein